jgi:hypothetical protein
VSEIIEVQVSGDVTNITIVESSEIVIVEVHDEITGKQDALVSGTNIKTVNGNSLLGAGDLTISGSSGGVTDSQAIYYAIALGGA